MCSPLMLIPSQRRLAYSLLRAAHSQRRAHTQRKTTHKQQTHTKELQVNQKRLLLLRELIVQPIKSVHQSLSCRSRTLDDRPLAVTNLRQSQSLRDLRSIESSGNILLVGKYQQRRPVQFALLHLITYPHTPLSEWQTTRPWPRSDGQYRRCPRQK